MPLVKLGYLLIRTVAKPFAAVVKQQARSHPAFRRACIAVAQSYHRSEVRMKRGLEAAASKRRLPITLRTHAHAQPGSSEPAAATEELKIKPLDEAKAVEVGSEFIGEALVFFVAGTLLVLDQLSNRRKETERRSETERRFAELYQQVELLKLRLAEQEQQPEASPRPAMESNKLPLVN